MDMVTQLLKTIYETPDSCTCSSSTFHIGVDLMENGEIKPHQIGMRIGSGKSGFQFVSGNTPDDLLTYWNKRKLWKAYKWWLKNAPIDKFTRY